MSPHVRHLATQALALPRRSRALLADVLLDSLDDEPTGDFEREWAEVAKRRDREISEGRVQCRSHEDVMASAREALRCSE